MAPARSEEVLTYDAARRVPFLHGGGYERCEYHWWIQNTGQPSDLYLNGVYQGSEYGNYLFRVQRAWNEWQPYGCAIGVVDIDNWHGQQVRAVAQLVNRADVLLSNSLRTYPDDVAAGISNFVSAGINVILVTVGTGNHPGVSNACRYAESAGSLVVCAVPNAGVDIDVTPDWPSAWAGEITSIVPVTATDRAGNLYGPNTAAWGTNTFGAPGRNIVAAGTYSSGTSYAAAIAAGCLALTMEFWPGKSSVFYRNALAASSTPIAGTRRINPANIMYWLTFYYEETP